jgi:rubrerythrin
MDEDKYREVVRFAAEKEVQAYEFYMKAAEMTPYSGAKELFGELAGEEKRHRELLQEIRIEKVLQLRLDPVPDLKISDYLVEEELQPDADYASILRVAMKMEEHSLHLYNDLRDAAGDEDLRKLFTFLAQQEARHKLRLEKVYDEEILK